jgi:hypothetical protein
MLITATIHWPRLRAPPTALARGSSVAFKPEEMASWTGRLTGLSCVIRLPNPARAMNSPIVELHERHVKTTLAASPSASSPFTCPTSRFFRAPQNTQIFSGRAMHF